MQADLSDKLAHVICRRVFCGIPLTVADVGSIVEACVRCLPCLRECSQEAAEAFADELSRALRLEIVLSQTEKARWAQ